MAVSDPVWTRRACIPVADPGGAHVRVLGKLVVRLRTASLSARLGISRDTLDGSVLDLGPCNSISLLQLVKICGSGELNELKLSAAGEEAERALDVARSALAEISADHMEFWVTDLVKAFGVRGALEFQREVHRDTQQAMKELWEGE